MTAGHLPPSAVAGDGARRFLPNNTFEITNSVSALRSLIGNVVVLYGIAVRCQYVELLAARHEKPVESRAAERFCFSHPL